MVRAFALAVILSVVASATQAAECGTMASQDRIDRAAYKVVRDAVDADAEGRPQAAFRFARPDGSPVSVEALARLPRGWLAGPDPVAAREAGIWSLNRSGLDRNAMLVRIGEGEAAISRRVGLRCLSGLWVITGVVRHPEGDQWSDLLSAR